MDNLLTHHVNVIGTSEGVGNYNFKKFEALHLFDKSVINFQH